MAPDPLERHLIRRGAEMPGRRTSLLLLVIALTACALPLAPLPDLAFALETQRGLRRRGFEVAQIEAQPLTDQAPSLSFANGRLLLVGTCAREEGHADSLSRRVEALFVVLDCLARAGVTVDDVAWTSQQPSARSTAPTTGPQPSASTIVLKTGQQPSASRIVLTTESDGRRELSLTGTPASCESAARCLEREIRALADDRWFRTIDYSLAGKHVSVTHDAFQRTDDTGDS